MYHLYFKEHEYKKDYLDETILFVQGTILPLEMVVSKANILFSEGLQI
jgi:hypothetical protein